MGDIVNLRRAKKAKQRNEADQAAAEARALHGRTKAAKIEERARREKAARDLDAHRRDQD